MSDLKHLLQDARGEILQIRRENEILRAKVEMIELFACLLHTQPARSSQGMAPDVAWAIQKKLDELQLEEAQKPNQTAAGKAA